MPDIFFDQYGNLIKIAVSAPVIYSAVVLFIRISGKRSTAQMNNFDWIVTVALGSLVASGLLMENVTIVEALFAIALLMGMQYLFTWLAFRFDAFASLIKAEPTLLMQDGAYLRQAMRRERVTESEVLAAIREQGLHRLDQARWVILETDASFSVIPKSEGTSEPTTLTNIAGANPGRGTTDR